MRATDQSRGINTVSLFATIFLVIFLPESFKFRSPDGVEEGWYSCVFTALGLLLWNAVGLIVLWRARWTSRLWLYISSGITVGILFFLLHLCQEAKQFDYEHHGGKGYYLDHPPAWRP